jgi:hypothetical protein
VGRFRAAAVRPDLGVRENDHLDLRNTNVAETSIVPDTIVCPIIMATIPHTVLSTHETRADRLRDIARPHHW